MNDFLLPHEIMDGAGVPDRHRNEVAYRVVAAKYCALVEMLMGLTEGKPVRMSMERVKEIAGFDHTSDPEKIVMVAEDPAGEHHISVRLATVDEIRAVNHRYALSRMGSRRN